jgi:hypothetical protein
MLEQYNDSLEASQAALEQAQEASNAAGIKLMDGVSMEAARGYAEQMRNVYLMNEEASKDLSDQLEKVVGTLDEVDKTKFVSTLNALDWQSVESLETLPETLEEIGVSVP